MGGDGATGAPVTELEYKRANSATPYSKRRVWRHIGELRVVPRVINLVPKTYVLGVGFFCSDPMNGMVYLIIFIFEGRFK